MPAGRPSININWDEFEKLCEIQCTLTEISGWFRCSEDTIERAVEKKYGIKFAEAFEQKRGKGKIAIRRAQVQKALNGDTTMLIWLGKNGLGQTDKQEVDHNLNGPIEVKFVPHEE